MNTEGRRAFGKMASCVENADKEMGTSSLDDSGPPQKSRAQHIRDLGEVRQLWSAAALQKTDLVCYQGKLCHPEM